jgi:hypothetical protein
VRESENKSQTQKSLKNNGKYHRKIQNLHLRYSHIPVKLNRNTLYKPRPIVKKTKKAPINPSGASWNLMTEELKRPTPKRMYRKYTETIPVHTRKTKVRVAKLYKPPSTEKENVSLLQSELNRTNDVLYRPNKPLGSKI